MNVLFMSNLFLVLYCCKSLIQMPLVTVVLRIHVIIKFSSYMYQVFLLWIHPKMSPFFRVRHDGVEL